jgi:hypothetical protein
MRGGACAEVGKPGDDKRTAEVHGAQPAALLDAPPVAAAQTVKPQLAAQVDVLDLVIGEQGGEGSGVGGD